MMSEKMIKEIVADIDDCICAAKHFYFQKSDVFDMLGLCGYKRLMELKWMKEIRMKKMLHRFSVNDLGFIVPKYDPDKREELIHNQLYNLDRMNVDGRLVKDTVKNTFDEWLEMLERDYLYFIEIWYKLIENKQVDLACFVEKMVKHHEIKIKYLTREIVKLKTVDYDVWYIMEMQEALHDKIRDHHMSKVHW